MKKNAMLKIAAILMVAVLLTTCAISSTFAKYVTAEKGVTSNTATVAKWGITITSTSDDAITLFKDAYANDVQGAIVEGTTRNVVVAPGTASTEAFAVQVSGTPEVDYELIVKADLNLGSNWKDKEGAYYCPLVITVDGTEYCGLSYDDAAAFETAVESAIVTVILGEVPEKNAAGEYVADFEANTPVRTEANELAVSWSWEFENKEVQKKVGSETVTVKQDNVKDTFLGDKHNATVQISYSVAAQQISR
jgi:hypothetical protein